MYKAIEQIKREFENKGIKYAFDEQEDSQIIRAGIPIENGPRIMVLFIARDDDNDIAVRIFGLISQVKEPQKKKLLDALNICNSKFRFYKFYIDADNDVNVEYDFLTEANNIGPMALEALVRISSILDEAYPIMMKALYKL